MVVVVVSIGVLDVVFGMVVFIMFVVVPIVVVSLVVFDVVMLVDMLVIEVVIIEELVVGVVTAGVVVTCKIKSMLLILSEFMQCVSDSNLREILEFQLNWKRFPLFGNLEKWFHFAEH